MKKLIAIVLCATALCGSATQYSKLGIITSAKSIGKWEVLKAWIANAGIQDEFQNCAYLSDDYPQYAALTNALVTSGVLTAAEVQTILANSKDTAISDEMIRRVVENDCKSANGRIKWHGKLVSNTIDTNALTRTQVFADGWVFVERFKSVEALPVEKRLSIAEQRAMREEAARRQAERQAKIKAERIAELTTNMNALAVSLANAKQYPLQLATMLLQVELNKLIGTNVVNAVVTPGS